MKGRAGHIVNRGHGRCHSYVRLVEPISVAAGSHTDMSNLPLIVAIALFGAWIVMTRMGKLAPSEAKRLVSAGALLVDVRSPSEFSSGHINGAKNIPVQDVERRARELAKDKDVIVYCASGMRSASAARTLKRLGFGRVHDLGAMGRWS
jgi:rhodanese-related sulfurtransferase